ncbi:MAG: hypothetical protein ABIQ36_11185 [Rhodanobacter sp.]
MNRIFRVFMLAACLAAPLLAFAGDDIAGSKDDPLLTRYPGSYIGEYSKAYNATEYKVGAGASANTHRWKAIPPACAIFMAARRPSRARCR